jgi:CTP:molybdopterin cytidylyltransferase MocA
MTDRGLGRGLPAPLSALVLAAGAARRYGSPKALALWRGKPLLQHTLDALAPLAPVTLVLGAEAARIREWVVVTGPIVTHDDWSEGLAELDSRGTRCPLSAYDPRKLRILIALGDQPTITRDDYAALISTWHDHLDRIVAREARRSARRALHTPTRILWSTANSARRSRVHARSSDENARASSTSRYAAARFDVDTPADLQALTKSCRQPLARRW